MQNFKTSKITGFLKQISIDNYCAKNSITKTELFRNALKSIVNF